MRTRWLWSAQLAIAVLGAADSGSAQPRKVEITPYAGYQVGGSASSRAGSLAIGSDPAYGLLFDVRVRPDATMQFLFNRQDTRIDIRVHDPLGPSKRLSPALVVDYYHFGGTVEFPRERLRPYIALTVGATRFDLDAVDVRDEWRFSIGFGGGLKTHITDRFGLRVDARVWPTFVNTSGGFFCGSPGGCLVSIRSDFIVQAGASVGLFIGL